MKKKGQGGGGAEIVVLLLAIFVAIYVLLIPPCDRCKLINPDGDCDDICADNENNDLGESVLISESIGSVSDTGEDKIEHELDDISLFLRTEPELQNLAESLYVSRTSFSTKSQDLTFKMDNLENLKNALLSFSVYDPEGELTVELNGNTIFSGFVSSGNAKIVYLPSGNLQEFNSLKISVSSPGGAFWRTNHYTINDLVLKQEFEEVHSSETRTFVVSSSEFDALDKVTLEYNIYCNELKDTAYLKIYLNDEILTSYALGCITSTKKLEIGLDDIEEGSNEIKFLIDEGDFLITRLKVISELDETIDYIYEFEVSNSQYNSISSGDKKAWLELDLSGGKKRADIILNDNKIVLNTNSDEFEKDVSSYITSDANVIEIEPSTEFEIDKLKIRLK